MQRLFSRHCVFELLFGGHDSPLKGSPFHNPKKVTAWIARNMFFPQQPKIRPPKLLEPTPQKGKRHAFKRGFCFKIDNADLSMEILGKTWPAMVDMSPKCVFFPKLSNWHSRDIQNKTNQGLYYCFSNQQTINLTPCKFNSSPLKKKWSGRLLSFPDSNFSGAILVKLWGLMKP